MSSGEIIREEIAELLISHGFVASIHNVETIFRKHLGDPQDRPLSRLIVVNSCLLED